MPRLWVTPTSCANGPTSEPSDSRPAVIASVTLDNQSAPPKPAPLELRSAAVRSSDLVRHSHQNTFLDRFSSFHRASKCFSKASNNQLAPR